VTMLVKTLRRWWEKWLRWPYAAATIGMCVAAGVTQARWVELVALAMVGVSVAISFAYAVALGRLLRDGRQRKRESEQRVAAIIARRGA
jgi:hypothetical protein